MTDLDIAHQTLPNPFSRLPFFGWHIQDYTNTQKSERNEILYLIENALRLSTTFSSLTTRCERFCLFLSWSKSIAAARSSDWWHIISLSEMDFMFCKTNVPPKRECRPGGGCTWCLDFSRFLAVTNSCSSRCFSAALRCNDASANDAAVCKGKSTWNDIQKRWEKSENINWISICSVCFISENQAKQVKNSNGKGFSF